MIDCNVLSNGAYATWKVRVYIASEPSSAVTLRVAGVDIPFELSITFCSASALVNEIVGNAVVPYGSVTAYSRVEGIKPKSTPSISISSSWVLLLLDTGKAML